MNTKFYTLSSYKNTLTSFLCHMSCKIETTGIHCQKVHFHVMGHARSLVFFLLLEGGNCKESNSRITVNLSQMESRLICFLFQSVSELKQEARRPHGSPEKNYSQ